MLNKNDPLINSVTKVMQENQVRRNVEQAINEAFGITSKNHLPFQAHAEYDALVEEMTQEALVGGQHKLDVNKNNRLDKHDFKMLRGMKKKPVEEAMSALAGTAPGASGGSAAAGGTSATSMATGRAAERTQRPPMGVRGMRPTGRNVAGMQSSKTLTVSARGGTMEEEALDEVLDTDEKKMDYAKKASDQIKAYSERGGAYDTSEKGKKDAKGVEKRTRGLQSLVKKIQKDAMKEEALDEISKKMAGKYTKAAANDLADKTDPNYGFMTDKDEDQVERETENRRKGIQRAVKSMMKEKAIKEERHKKVVRNILEKMRAKAGMEEEVVQERMTGLAPPVQSAIRKKEVANILKTPNPNTTAATGMQTTGAARIGPTGVKAVGAAPLSDAGKDAAVARMRQQRTDVRTGGAVGAAADAARPAPKPVATTPKPAAPARTIQGPAGTSATMTGRGTDAIVKTGGQTYKGSVVKNRFGGQSIQNFRAGGTPMGPKGKVNE